ncbi:MAG: insulinase family protein, partial [Deltaproteobacteria bacterium]|nr:insulinase family protein [Deltaproteobacteria bacterium]
MPSTDAAAARASEPRCITLGNGAQIVVVPTRESAGKSPDNAAHPAGTVAVQLWILGGTAAERRDEHGCAHLLEHMLFKPSRHGGDLATDIERLGGDINAFTSHDETVVHATVPVGLEGEALDALLPPVLQPSFDPAALTVESRVVVEEIRQYRDDPGAQAMQGLYSSLYGAHPYARPVLGTVADVRSHDAARLRRFHRRVYAGRRVRLVVVGPVGVKSVVRRAQRWLEALPRGRADAGGGPVLDPLPRARVRVAEADVREAHIQLAWRAPAVPTAVACALEVASIVLGYGDASRLTLRVRRQQQLVSDVLASFYPARGSSSLVVAAHAEPGRVDEVVAAVLAEVQTLGRVPMPVDDLERA